MNAMNMHVGRAAAFALALAGCACTGAPGADAADAAALFDTDEDGRLAVPEGDGRPVLVDGVFTTGEWDDAAPMQVDRDVTLRIKHYRGHVFVGAMTGTLGAPLIDLFLEGGDGRIWQFHASAQLGERILTAPGQEDREFRWGMTSGWYANEVRWDQVARDSLSAAGAPDAAYPRTFNPYDGFEMQFRREKVGGSEWRLRVEILAAPDYDKAPHVYPAGTQAKSTEGWLVLELPAWAGAEAGAASAGTAAPPR